MENLLVPGRSCDASMYTRPLEPGTDQGGFKTLTPWLSCMLPVSPVFRLTIRGLFFQSKVASRSRKRRNPTWGELQARQTVQHQHLLPWQQEGLRGDLAMSSPHAAQEGMSVVGEGSTEQA